MLVSLPYPELFFGICSPMGTNNGEAVELLDQQLKLYGYVSERFKVTSLMSSIVMPGLRLDDKHKF
jgi:hypothetical protein